MTEVFSTDVSVVTNNLVSSTRAILTDVILSADIQIITGFRIVLGFALSAFLVAEVVGARIEVIAVLWLADFALTFNAVVVESAGVIICAFGELHREMDTAVDVMAVVPCADVTVVARDFLTGLTFAVLTHITDGTHSLVLARFGVVCMHTPFLLVTGVCCARLCIFTIHRIREGAFAVRAGVLVCTGVAVVTRVRRVRELTERSRQTLTNKARFFSSNTVSLFGALLAS